MPDFVGDQETKEMIATMSQMKDGKAVITVKDAETGRVPEQGTRAAGGSGRPDQEFARASARGFTAVSERDISAAYRVHRVGG